jgi:hypothetical protein
LKVDCVHVISLFLHRLKQLETRLRQWDIVGIQPFEQRQAETLKHSQMSPLGEIHRHLEDQDLTLLTHTISGVISDQSWQELVDRKAFA